MQLYKRKVDLTVGTTQIGDLNLDFSVKKTLKPGAPNTCDLQIYNLSPDTRKTLESASTLPVRLIAGYAGYMSQIYHGEVRAAWSHTEGPDIVTSMSSGDGEKARQSARINTSFGPSVPADIALIKIAEALGVGSGNVSRVAAELSAKGKASPYPRGTAVSGNAAKALTDFCRSADLEWSIQDGQIQILDLNKALVGKEVEIGPTSGMIGSPSSDNKKVISFTCLLIPEIKPGVVVVMKSMSLKGRYRVTTVEYKGQVMGSDWYCQVTAGVIA